MLFMSLRPIPICILYFLFERHIKAISGSLLHKSTEANPVMQIIFISHQCRWLWKYTYVWTEGCSLAVIKCPFEPICTMLNKLH